MEDSTEDLQWDLMFSYSWNQQDQVWEIKEKLEEKGFKIWMDTEQMAKYESMPEAMGDGISNSAGVVLFISADYEESARCKQEAEFVSKKNKPKFFIKVTENYHPSDDWLDFLMGDRLYFEMFSPEKMEENFANFEAAIRRVVVPQFDEFDEFEESDEEIDEVDEEIEEQCSVVCLEGAPKLPKPAEIKEKIQETKEKIKEFKEKLTEMKEIKEVDNSGKLGIDFNKIVLFKSIIYAVKQEDSKVIVRFKVNKNKMVKIGEKRWKHHIIGLAWNKKSLYALINKTDEESSSDEETSSDGRKSDSGSDKESEKEGEETGEKLKIYEVDTEKMKLKKKLKTKKISQNGSWIISGSGDSLFLIVSSCGAENGKMVVVHEFEDKKRKRELVLPKDDLTSNKAISKVVLVGRHLLVSAHDMSEESGLTQVACYGWSKSSDEVTDQKFNLEVKQFSTFAVTSSGVLVTRSTEGSWQLSDLSKDDPTHHKIEAGENYPVLALGHSLVLARYPDEEGTWSYRMMQLC